MLSFRSNFEIARRGAKRKKNGVCKSQFYLLLKDVKAKCRGNNTGRKENNKGSRENRENGFY